MDLAKLLAVSVTPVVLISASGLIALALYNRLGLINSRVRNFHREKIALLKEMATDDNLAKRLLLNMLSAQIASVMRKARLMVYSLFCLLLAVASFVLCSLMAAASVFSILFAYPALGFHFVGLALVLSAIALALMELVHSLSPMAEENAYLDFYAAGLEPSTTKAD